MKGRCSTGHHTNDSLCRSHHAKRFHPIHCLLLAYMQLTCLSTLQLTDMPSDSTALTLWHTRALHAHGCAGSTSMCMLPGSSSQGRGLRLP